MSNHIRAKLNKEALRVALDAAHDAKSLLAKLSEQKAAYDKKYGILRRLLSASNKRMPLSEIIDYIDIILGCVHIRASTMRAK